MKPDIRIGTGKTVSVKVSKDNCASAMGSGALDVFATPAMVALMEKAACEVVKDFLQEGESTVGTCLDISHVKATPVGETVEATATLVEVDGRRLVFDVIAKDSVAVIGTGKHERFVINVEKFLSKLK